MKATESQLIELLAKVGVQDVEIVEKEEDSDFDASASLTAIDTARTPIIKQKIEGELTDSITTAKQGELNGMFKKMLAKTFGVSRSQLDKFDSMDEAVEYAKTSYAEQFDGDRAEMEKKYNTLLERHNEEKQKIENEWKTKYTQLEEEQLTAKQVEYIHSQLKDKPITWDRMIAAREILNHAKSKYDVKLEDGKIKYYEKGKNIAALNAAGNEAINDNDIFREYLEPRNGWAKDTRHETPKELPKKEVNPYIERQQGDKLSASWEAIEAARAAAQQ